MKETRYSRDNVHIDEGSAFAAKSFNAGDFVCEYKGVVRKKIAEDWGDQRNASLGLGCYCLDAIYKRTTYVFDATASINDPGRYINHASKNYNLLKMPPVLIGEPPHAQLKIGFVARTEGKDFFFTMG